MTSEIEELYDRGIVVLRWLYPGDKESTPDSTIKKSPEGKHLLNALTTCNARSIFETSQDLLIAAQISNMRGTGQKEKALFDEYNYKTIDDIGDYIAKHCEAK